jgi:ribosomal protein L37E
MKPLKSVIAQWEPSASMSEDPVSSLRAEWASIVGEDVAANSRPAQVTRDALLIVTRSGAWSQQLAFWSERILSALSERTGASVHRLRFRVGSVRSAPTPARRRRPVRRSTREQREGAESLTAAFERFKADVAAAQRAKERAGWKECKRCGVRIYPSAESYCTPCGNARLQDRDARVARLLFEAPWLGYAGIVPLVGDLTLKEYETVRVRLLKRWKDVLERVRRTGGAQVTTRDRLIASSYVLLKSELDPERIAPAVVRDLLGDELHDIFYGSENI